MASTDRNFDNRKILDALEKKTGLMLGTVDADSVHIDVNYSRGRGRFAISLDVTMSEAEADEILFGAK